VKIVNLDLLEHVDPEYAEFVSVEQDQNSVEED
jgi:hypothetical protein